MKKIISIIVAVLMIATLFSTLVLPASAEEPQEAVLYWNDKPAYDGAALALSEAFDIVAKDLLTNNKLYPEFALEEGKVATYTIKLLKNVTMTKMFQPTKDCNIIIDGKLPDGKNAVISSTVTGNNFRFDGKGVKAVFKNVDIISSPTGGCLIQLHTVGSTDLDIVDCNIQTTHELYFTINTMRDDGGKTYVNIVRSTITQTNPATAQQLPNEGDTKYPYISQRGIIGTCNAGGMDHHLVLNVIDSTLKSQSSCIFVNTGSTADIDVKNSTLELLACDVALYYGGRSSSAAGKYYLPYNYEDNILDARCAVELVPVSKLKTTGTLRDGTYNTITFDAVDCLIKVPTGADTIHQIVAYNGINYALDNPYTLEGQTTAPDVSSFTVNETKTAELRAASGVTVNYTVGEPNTAVTTPFTEFDYPTLQTPGSDTTTTAGGDTTTATPAGDNTTAGGDTTTAPPAGDNTTAGGDATEAPAGDNTTAGGDTTTATPAGDNTTAGGDATEAPAGDNTTAGGDATEAPAGDNTTAGGDTTTAAPDVTTAAPATDAEGGCAGCAEGDGATAAIALAIAMAAAVAIIVKRK